MATCGIFIWENTTHAAIRTDVRNILKNKVEKKTAIMIHHTKFKRVFKKSNCLRTHVYEEIYKEKQINDNHKF